MNTTAQLAASALASLSTRPGSEFPGLAFEIVKAVHETADEIMDAAGGGIVADVPPRTIVSLVSHPVEGSAVRVEIWLPEAGDWNGCFLGLGSGGMGGWLMGPEGFAGPLKQGYAVAHCDLGTTVSGVRNPEVWKDFGHRATHLMTVAGKAITEKLYGKKIQRSYFRGGSTGGQQAFALAQRYPEDYDGIVAGIPAHDRTALHAYFVWNEQIFERAQFTGAQWEAVRAAGLEFMGRGDAAPEGCFGDPVVSAAEIEVVIALACAKEPSLTPAQCVALRDLFRGPRRMDNGAAIHGGFPIGAGFWSGREHFYPFHWVFGGDWDFMKFDFAADYDTYRAALSGDLDANDADLSRFRERGGKLLAYSGALDQVVPYHPTLAYYERVCERLGGRNEVMKFFRYWIVPGMGHGGGLFTNRFPDWLALLREWCENGVAPCGIHARRVNADGVVEVEVAVEPC